MKIGEELLSFFTMLIPPFIGVDFIMNSPKLGTLANNFILILGNYRYQTIKNIWGAGLAVDVKPPFKQDDIQFTIPKTGYPSDVTGKIVAANVIKTFEGKTDFIEKPWGKITGLCIMDAGKKEVIILSISLCKPRVFAIMIPNILNDSIK